MGFMQQTSPRPAAAPQNNPADRHPLGINGLQTMKQPAASRLVPGSSFDAQERRKRMRLLPPSPPPELNPFNAPTINALEGMFDRVMALAAHASTAAPVSSSPSTSTLSSKRPYYSHRQQVHNPVKPEERDTIASQPAAMAQSIHAGQSRAATTLNTARSTHHAQHFPKSVWPTLTEIAPSSKPGAPISPYRYMLPPANANSNAENAPELNQVQPHLAAESESDDVVELHSSDEEDSIEPDGEADEFGDEDNDDEEEDYDDEDSYGDDQEEQIETSAAVILGDSDDEEEVEERDTRDTKEHREMDDLSKYDEEEEGVQNEYQEDGEEEEEDEEEEDEEEEEVHEEEEEEDDDDEDKENRNDPMTEERRQRINADNRLRRARMGFAGSTPLGIISRRPFKLDSPEHEEDYYSQPEEVEGEGEGAPNKDEIELEDDEYEDEELQGYVSDAETKSFEPKSDHHDQSQTPPEASSDDVVLLLDSDEEGTGNQDEDEMEEEYDEDIEEDEHYDDNEAGDNDSAIELVSSQTEMYLESEGAEEPQYADHHAAKFNNEQDLTEHGDQSSGGISSDHLYYTEDSESTRGQESVATAVQSDSGIDELDDSSVDGLVLTDISTAQLSMEQGTLLRSDDVEAGLIGISESEDAIELSDKLYSSDTLEMTESAQLSSGSDGLLLSEEPLGQDYQSQEVLQGFQQMSELISGSFSEDSTMSDVGEQIAPLPLLPPDALAEQNVLETLPHDIFEFATSATGASGMQPGTFLTAPQTSDVALESQIVFTTDSNSFQQKLRAAADEENIVSLASDPSSDMSLSEAPAGFFNTTLTQSLASPTGLDSLELSSDQHDSSTALSPSPPRKTRLTRMGTILQTVKEGKAFLEHSEARSSSISKHPHSAESADNAALEPVTSELTEVRSTSTSSGVAAHPVHNARHRGEVKLLVQEARAFCSGVPGPARGGVNVSATLSSSPSFAGLSSSPTRRGLAEDASSQASPRAQSHGSYSPSRVSHGFARRRISVDNESNPMGLGVGAEQYTLGPLVSSSGSSGTPHSSTSGLAEGSGGVVDLAAEKVIQSTVVGNHALRAFINPPSPKVAAMVASGGSSSGSRSNSQEPVVTSPLSSHLNQSISAFSFGQTPFGFASARGGSGSVGSLGSPSVGFGFGASFVMVPREASSGTPSPSTSPRKNSAGRQYPQNKDRSSVRELLSEVVEETEQGERTKEPAGDKQEDEDKENEVEENEVEEDHHDDETQWDGHQDEEDNDRLRQSTAKVSKKKGRR